MGFEREACKKALVATKNDVQQAVHLLIHGEDISNEDPALVGNVKNILENTELMNKILGGENSNNSELEN